MSQFFIGLSQVHYYYLASWQTVGDLPQFLVSVSFLIITQRRPTNQVLVNQRSEKETKNWCQSRTVTCHAWVSLGVSPITSKQIGITATLGPNSKTVTPASQILRIYSVFCHSSGWFNSWESVFFQWNWIKQQEMRQFSNIIKMHLAKRYLDFIRLVIHTHIWTIYDRIMSQHFHILLMWK